MTPASFGVHSCRPLPQGGFEVDGRCYTGTITLGTRFTWLRDKRGGDVKLSLSVQRIVAYGQPLEEIAEGLTARLTLVGQGESVLAEDSVLSEAHPSHLDPSPKIPDEG